jgi:hypothetical protein
VFSLIIDVISISYPTAPVHTYASFLINQTVSPFAASILSPGQPLYELSHIMDNMTSTFSKVEQMYIPTVRFLQSNW